MIVVQNIKFVTSICCSDMLESKTVHKELSMKQNVKKHDKW